MAVNIVAGAYSPPPAFRHADIWAARPDGVPRPSREETTTVPPTIGGRGPASPDLLVAARDLRLPTAGARNPGTGAAVTSDGREFHLQSLSMQSNVSFAFSLTTQEGDVVTLQFSQRLGFQQLTAQHTLGGDGVQVQAHTERSDGEFAMTVSGDLSESELAAVNRVVFQVQQAAGEFFEGSVSGALQKLSALDFDPQTLADLSLDLRQTKAVELRRVYGRFDEQVKGNRGLRNDDALGALQRAAHRDADVGHAVGLLADAQRRLIGEAMDVLDELGATRLVRGLLPAMLAAKMDAASRDTVALGASA